MTKRNMLAALLVAGVLSVMGDSKHTSYAKEEMKVELHALETLPKNLTGQISRVCQSQYQAKREEVLEQIRFREEEAKKAAEEAARKVVEEAARKVAEETARKQTEQLESQGIKTAFFCQQCGAKLSPNARFCEFCGAKVK